MSAQAPSPGEAFAFVPVSEAPGWYVAPAAATGRFIDLFGAVRLRAESADTARIRITPSPAHRNLMGTVHGGFALAVIDQALFLGPSALGIRGVRGGVTIEASTMFLAPLAVERSFDVVIEVLRETGKMLFLRGILEQNDVRAVTFSGVIRKAPDGA